MREFSVMNSESSNNQTPWHALLDTDFLKFFIPFDPRLQRLVVFAMVKAIDG